MEAAMVVTGTFATPESVRRAVDDLLAAGFAADRISAVTASERPIEEHSLTNRELLVDLAAGAGLGALVAGAAGGAIVPLLLPGAGLLLVVGKIAFDGALAGGVLGAAVAAGHEEQTAADLANQVKDGRLLVIVHTDADAAGASAVLEAAGATEVKTSTPASQPPETLQRSKPTMDIPMNAAVECIDGPGGHITRVLLNPITDKITHLVIREPGVLGVEREVPMEYVLQGMRGHVRVRATREELSAFPPFEESHYIPLPDGAYPDISTDYRDISMMGWPYAAVNGVFVTRESIPPDELAVRRGHPVEAADGPIGRVDEFLIDPVSDEITHLVMREGHFWHRRDVTIPVDQIERIDEAIVRLKLNKKEIERLPTVPARR
jgi:hypothetical protein